MQLTHETSTFKVKKFPLVLVLDSVTSPANVGSLFRLADAFGVEKIIICGATVDLDSNRLRRTARSTVQLVPYEIEEDGAAVCDNLSKRGFLLAALEISSKSVPVESPDYGKIKRLALVVGNESSGISEKLLQKMDKQLHINMFGRNSSMNVAQAAGIALFEITKSLQPIP
ncbi:MAG: TrmH family RNA methyltransferase [Salinimicrobium sp.]